MRVVFGVLFTAVVLIVMAHVAITGFFVWRCYEGNEQACYMISKKNDVTLRQR